MWGVSTSLGLGQYDDPKDAEIEHGLRCFRPFDRRTGEATHDLDGQDVAHRSRRVGVSPLEAPR